MRQRQSFTLFLAIGDILALYTALGLTLVTRYGMNITKPWEIHKYPFAVIFCIWIFLFFIAELYEQNAWNADRTVKERMLRTIAAAGVTSVVLFYLVPVFVITPKTNLLIQIGYSAALLLGWRMLASVIIRNTSKTNVLFFGDSEEIRSLAHTLALNPHLGYCVSALVTAKQPSATSSDFTFPIVPFTTDISHMLEEKNISLVVASQEIHSNKEFVHMLYDVIPRGITFTDFPTFHEALTGKIPISLISEIWFLENLASTSKRMYEFIKRVLDICIALAAGIVTILLLPVIALGILCSTPRDVFQFRARRARKGDGIILFRQPRVGKNGILFNFIKFRSQRLGSERLSESKDIKNDPRQYPFGKFMRAFYMDELPQVWNVLKGEMSFIGPRPERPEYVTRLAESIPFYKIRLLVPPGITGWAQINMKNDASVEDAPEKLQHDLYYIKNRSLALDLNIALKTIWVILSREGR